MEDAPEEKSSASPEKQYTIRSSFELSRGATGLLDGFAGASNISRNEMVKRLVIWGLESIDPNTLDFPEAHPRTGRSKKDILENPPSGKPSTRS